MSETEQRVAAPSDAKLSLSERADALEQQMSDELDRAVVGRSVVIKSVLFTSGERDPTKAPVTSPASWKGMRLMMCEDPCLP